MQCISELDGKHIIQAEGGYCHTLARTIEGHIYSLGCSEDGERGVDADNERSLPVATRVVVPNGDGPIIEVATGLNHSLAPSAYPTIMATTMKMLTHQHSYKCQDCPAERWVSLRATVTVPSWVRMGRCIPLVIRAMANLARGMKKVGETTAWVEIYGQTVVVTTPMHRGHGTSRV
jgi:hypothetical protein